MAVRRDLTCHTTRVDCSHMATHLSEILQTPENDWVTFPGGELEGKRPKRLCVDCRERLRRAAAGAVDQAGVRHPLCFQCYRLELIAAALGRLATHGVGGSISEALPFQAVDRAARLIWTARPRGSSNAGVGRFADRAQAQIAARRALQDGKGCGGITTDAARNAFAGAVHAVELHPRIVASSWYRGRDT